MPCHLSSVDIGVKSVSIVRYVCRVCCSFCLNFSAVTSILTIAGSKLVDCCLGCCYHSNTLIVATAAEIYVGIVSLKWKGETKHALQSVTVATMVMTSDVTVRVRGLGKRRHGKWPCGL